MSEDDSLRNADAREKILATACRLFSQYGYENTSLAQVAREAKVSKALIFWHFDTKEKLFESVLRKTLEPFYVDAQALQGLDERGQIDRLIDDFYDFVRDNVYSVRFFLSLVLREERHPGEVFRRIGELYALYRDQIARAIARGREKGLFRAGAAPAALEASMIMATLAGIFVLQFLDDEHSRDPKQLLEQLKAAVAERLLPAGS